MCCVGCIDCVGSVVGCVIDVAFWGWEPMVSCSVYLD